MIHASIPACVLLLACSDGKHPVFDLLKANFDAAYGGNRAPMPIFIHTPWLAKNRDAVAAFAGTCCCGCFFVLFCLRTLLLARCCQGRSTTWRLLTTVLLTSCLRFLSPFVISAALILALVLLQTTP
jgi:hypothetical protein